MYILLLSSIKQVLAYLKLQNITQTALQLNISTDSVQHILKIYNIKIKDSNDICRLLFGKKINMLDKNNLYLQSFDTISDAAKYLKINNYSTGKESTIRTHISEVCQKKRKTAFGFIWQYAE